MGHVPRLSGTESVIPKPLNIFSPPGTISSVIYVTEKEYFNKGDSTRGAKIRFNVSPSSSEYISLTDCTLCVKCRINKIDDATKNLVELEAADFCCPVNNTLHSLFSQIDVYFNDRLMNDFSPNNSYVSYLKMITGFGSDAQSGWTECMMYTPDTTGHIDSNVGGPGASNYSMGRRTQWTKNKDFTLVGPLFSDVFQVERWLPNGIPITINLTQNSDSFRLITDDTENKYVLTIKDARLRLKLISVHPVVTIAHEMSLKNGIRGLFPYMKMSFRSRTWDKDLSSGMCDDIFNGRVPNLLMMVMVSNSDYGGNINTNPFNFGFFDVRALGLTINSRLYNGRQLLVDMSEGDCCEALAYVHQNLRRWGRDKGLVLGRDDWAGGKALFVFDLEGLGSNAAFPLVQQGSLSLSMNFGAGGPGSNISLLFFGFSRDVFAIDVARNVLEMPKKKIAED